MFSMNHMFRYSLPFSFLIVRFLTLDAEPISSFSLQGFNDVSIGDSNSDFTLFGDAQIANGGSFVNLTSPSSGSGVGQIVYKKPFKFLESNSSIPVSLSSDFTFSISPGNGVGLAFVIFPTVELSKVFGRGPFGISEKFDQKFVAVEYDTRKDDNVGGMNGSRVGVDVGNFASAVVSNVSSLGLLLNGGEPLRSWIDYEASSKRLEIRLGKSGTEKPYEPFISYPIDLSKMWGGREVLLGVSSSRGNSSQISSLSSWRFRIRTVPSSLHSEPLDPMASAEEHQEGPRKKSCFLTVLGTLIFATGCGTLLAFSLLFLWVVFIGRHSTVAPELPMNPIECKYDKVDVTVDNASDDSKN